MATHTRLTQGCRNQIAKPSKTSVQMTHTIEIMIYIEIHNKVYLDIINGKKYTMVLVFN